MDVLMRLAVAWTALAFLGGCAHDFGQFEATDDGGPASDAADGKAEDHRADDAHPDASDDSFKEAAPDGPCSPSQSCLDTAMSCGDGCSETKTTCEASCHGRLHCMERCQMQAMGCADMCVNTCTGCTESAGCPGAEMCQSAAGGGE
jgi:hypothetical protein